MNKAKLKRLLHQYFTNTINRADCLDLLNYLDNTDPDEVIDLVDEEMLSLNEAPQFSEQQANTVLNRIKTDPRFTIPGTEEQQPRVTKFYQKAWFKIAATLLFFGATALVVNHKNTLNKTADSVKPQPEQILPGGNRAILTMAGGMVISLTNASNGLLANTGQGSVVKTSNGQIRYNTLSKLARGNKDEGYNTLSTPKGGEYQVVLADGTKVWLNAASSISYPVAFNGTERHVKLSGEAYFEVAKNKRKPFYVSINNVQVRVLGTHFNIAAYNDESDITTTLLEGSVLVTKNKSQSLIKPGQQAAINNGSDKIDVSEANINNTMAWKNGYFVFDDENIADIMKKVSRWYDVDVEYRGTFNNQKFGGIYYRSKGINELLQYLEKIGSVHFNIEGRRIIVMN